MLRNGRRPLLIAAPAGIRAGGINARRMAPAGYTGMGAIDWNALVQGGFGFGGQFLKSWEARGVARAGQNPYGGNPYQTTAGGPMPQLSPEQLAQIAATNNGQVPGSQVSQGLAGMWQSAANALGVSSSTLTLLAAGGIGLAVMTPPGRRR